MDHGAAPLTEAEDQMFFDGTAFASASSGS